VVQEPSLRYKGDWHAIKTIAKTEGFRGIYKGYGATLASFGPFSAVYMTLYEEMKAQACKVLDKPTEAELPFACFWGGGALAGSISAFVTSPLDMAKLRIQVDRGSSKVFTYGYRNVLDGVRQIWRQDGVKGLFRGSAARVAFHGPSTGITIGLYDSVKTWVNTLRDQEQL
jgi:hypothetical protein